jgi:hypothetical protein
MEESVFEGGNDICIYMELIDQYPPKAMSWTAEANKKWADYDSTDIVCISIF